MSLGKLPVLSWVSGSHGKRRLKSELTPDMISPPLGDFRHTMHVGRGGDVFGDTSFLSNHGGAETAKANNFFTRTLRHVRRTPLKSRGSGCQAKASPAPPPISPIIKNAVSLPQLNEGMYDGGSGSQSLTSRFSFKSASNSFSKTHQVYGLESGFCTIPRVPRLEKAQENAFTGEDELNRSDSLLSFRLDLGPSLMSELLQVMSFSETNGNEVGEDGADLPNAEGTKDEVLPASGAAHGEDKATLSYWDRSGQTSLSGASSLPGLSVHANGEAHAIEGAGKDPAWASGPGAVPRGTPWQGHWNDCSIEAGEFDRAAQVLARHYGGTSTPRSSEKVEGPRQARTQTLWESPSSSSWRSQVTGESLSPEATWNQGEEEAELSSLQEGYVGARGMHSNSFEYADEEEDDEVKV
ncbi:cdc42 effector protein 1 [Cuculus canorus]|uniref:cdc42 effector protein 1 n=1 Tax=Cuculus canorus TaxID=55661 RepID=UPI0023AA305B|nr:cdc42 effector protein 1 [Cuculus canorus]XP_053928327.1 cdc42 effector protein 1 [Cuculus canorus]XP_053928328.1 cdc42 effector protein 1 [Cuculus canorus]XP_053928333.1 cdc42 effector protein 1 [Cuculus canorus]